MIIVITEHCRYSHDGVSVTEYKKGQVIENPSNELLLMLGTRYKKKRAVKKKAER